MKKLPIFISLELLINHLEWIIMPFVVVLWCSLRTIRICVGQIFNCWRANIMHRNIIAIVTGTRCGFYWIASPMWFWTVM